jgi:hypothetical protein
MTGPTNPFGHNPFDSGSPGQGSAGGLPPGPPPSELGSGGEANTLATLSVIFAFVFAPAGAVLGHLGLAQIARTHQRGRDRALVGVTLSYVIITAAVVALVVWAGVHDARPTHSAPPPATTTRAATTATAPPPPPTVAPADVASLLPDLQQTKDITGNQTLNEGPTSREMSMGGLTVDRQECYAALASGAAPAYNQPAVRGFYESEFLNSDPVTGLVVGLDVAAFDHSTGARAQLDDLISQWKRCVTGPTAVHYPDGRSFTASFTPPTDAGDGITTMEVRLLGLRQAGVRAVAVKANVVVDLILTTTTNTADLDHTLAIAKFILAKIPG